MCSRYALICAPMDLLDRYDLTSPPRAPLPIPEIKPTDPAPVKGSKRLLLRKLFGIPSPHDGKPILNARSETLTEKPLFRRLLGNRVLIPATGYFEWRKDGKARHRNVIAPQDKPGGLFSFAGLYDGQHFVIITCPPAPSIAHIHHRMPVILPPDAEAAWVSDAPFEAVASCLSPWSGPLSAEEDPAPLPPVGDLFG